MPTQKPWVLIFIAVAALWGASFLFMRVAAVEFGALPTSALRMGLGTLSLLPVLLFRGLLPQLWVHRKHLALFSLLNAAIPFSCFAFAVLHITTGLSAILNATVPMFGALVAWWWLGQTLTLLRTVGVLVGFFGIVLLAGEQAALKGDDFWLSIAAMLACLVATLCYGVSGNYAKRYMGDINSWVVAEGTMLGASLWLAIPAALAWPPVMPTAQAWGAVLCVAVFCSAMAFVLYFKLLQRVDAPRAMSVTYLIPVFALCYGVLFLGEHISWWMVLCGAVVLLGTALATGLIQGPAATKASSPQ